jgi:hypothetical protein
LKAVAQVAQDRVDLLRTMNVAGVDHPFALGQHERVPLLGPEGPVPAQLRFEVDLLPTPEDAEENQVTRPLE